MQEILTLSLSQRANHLTTHFYNAQESYFDYTRTSTSSSDWTNDPTVHFRPSLQSNNTVNYHPRALIWDLNGGFGSLGQFEYFPQREGAGGEQEEAAADPLAFNRGVIKRERIRKSEYQKALDYGLALPDLKAAEVQYWSDFNRVVFEPKTFNALQDWVYDPVTAPEGSLASALTEKRAFKGFEVGVQEWDKVGLDFMEDKYRVSLEECDSLNGINVVSDLDSAWAGFTSQMLTELRDDYNPKSMVFNWAVYNGRSMKELTNREVLNRIKAFVELNKSSSLLIPLGTPQFSKSSGSLWETSALQNIVFESLQTLNSQTPSSSYSDRVNFHHLEACLVRGTHRTVVSNVTAQIGQEEINFCGKFYESFKRDNRDNHQFNAIAVQRPSQNQPSGTSSGTSSVAVAEPEDKEQQQQRTTTNYNLHKPYATPSSYPQTFISSDATTSISLSMESSARRTFLDMKDWISKMVRGDERAEMIDELSTMAAEYEYGWGDSDESDDDY